MNQENNFNIQGNNGIPNNQPLNNQAFNQSMGFNQQSINPQPQPTPSFQQSVTQEQSPQPMNNTVVNGSDNNQKFNSKPPKKINLGLIIGISVAVVAIIVGVVIILSTKSNDNSNKGTNDNQVNNSNNETNLNCKGTNTVLNNLKGETVNYYYNIDTSKFNKNLFDGNINFYGTIVNGKITTNKLKSAGISVEYSISRLNDEYNVRYFSTPKFSIDTSSDIINSDMPLDNMGNDLNVVDYTGGSEIYSDTALISCMGYFHWTLTGRNIYPNQLQIDDYSDITIDLVLDKLGNPTYVNGRTNSCLENEYTYTTYVYVYDDVAFLFAFYNWDNMKLAGVFYYPIEELNGIAPQTWTYDGKTYTNPIEVLELQQKNYKSNNER